MKGMSKEEIIDAYMETVQETGRLPYSVEDFCNEIEIEPSLFYAEFESLKEIDKTIYLLFFIQTKQLLERSGSFEEMLPQEKLLSFYFTFFEVLSANKPFVLVSFPTEISEINRLYILSDLRKEFLTFAGEVFENNITSDISSLEKIKTLTYEEGAYAQLLFILNFWLRDKSADTYKTDLLIEKSLKATFDVLAITALNSVFDLGKFLFKEIFTHENNR
jgi:hypothetical protein